MSGIVLAPLGEVAPALLDALRAELPAEFGAPCRRILEAIDPSFAWHSERGQHHSTEILARLARSAPADAWRVLGVTDRDLYIPILTFVFGEAQVGGPCALVSTHRLRQEFYGLPPNAGLVRERLVKESVHELGHTLGLMHCEDLRCAMAASHSVEQIDLKQPTLCPACRDRRASEEVARRTGS